MASRLEAADRAFHKEKGSCFLWRAVPFWLGVVLLAFLLDVLLQWSAFPRVLLAAGFVGAGLLAVGWAIYVAWGRRSRFEFIARLLESRDASLGSKLINLLQLQAQTDDPALTPLTRQMARQAIIGYVDQLRGVDFTGLARTDRPRTLRKQAALISLCLAIVLAVFYPISRLEILRFGDPLGDHPAYSLTRLELIEPGPAGARVVYNGNLTVKVKFTGHRPSELFLTSYPPDHPEQAVTVPMYGQGKTEYHQQLEKVKSELLVFAHTKNQHSISKKQPIHVLLTPKLDQAYAQVIPPAYTHLKPEEKPFQFKSVSALAGSQVRFRLQSNRPLRSGAMEVIRSAETVERISMTPTADHEVAGVIEAKESGRLRFSLVDRDGIASQDSWEGSLTVTHDLPPRIQITQPERDSFVTLDFKFTAQIEAADDYGIKKLRLHRALNQVYSEPRVLAFDPEPREAQATLEFDWRELGVKPGDVISLFAEAIDTAPEASLARSQTVNLMVIGEEEYNAYLRGQRDLTDLEGKYAALLEHFQELIEDQKKVGAAIDELRQQEARTEAKEKSGLASTLDNLLAKQNELNQKLAKEAGQMEHFVRPKPLYDFEAEMQRELAQQAEAIRDSVEANGKDTQRVARQSSPPAGSRQISPQMLQDFKQASDDQLKRLGAAEQETQKEVMDTLQDLSQLHELMKDFNRFEELHRLQQSLVEQTRAYNRPGPLSREDQLALKNLADTERQVGGALDELKSKLGDDAKAAGPKFPKAAQGAADLAEQMEKLRLVPLAGQATDSMLAGQGEKSLQLAERLSNEMASLFSECQSQGSQMGQEMDTYLRLQKGMNPGNSLEQMRQCRKFGLGKGFGFGVGPAGLGGNSGYLMNQPSFDVFGNENLSSKGKQDKPSAHGLNQGGAAAEPPDKPFDRPDALKGFKAITRESGVVTPESLIEEYRDLVDQYFKTIAK